MVLIVGGYLVKLSPQSPHSVLAMNPLQVPPLLVMSRSQEPNTRASRNVDVPRQRQWHVTIVQALSPRVLIHDPEHFATLTEYASDPFSHDRLGICEVVQEETHRPLPGSIGRLELRTLEVKVRHCLGPSFV